MLWAQLAFAVRGHQQNRGAGELVSEHLQHEQAAGVGPVQVIQHKQERAAAGGTEHVVREGPEEPTTGSPRLSCGHVLETGQALPELGQQDCELWAVRPQISLQLVVAREPGQPAEHLDPGPVGRKALGFLTAPPGYRPTMGGRLAGQLLREPRLADAGVTHQQHGVPAAVARVVPGRQEIGHLARSADESLRSVRRRGPGRGDRRRQGDWGRGCWNRLLGLARGSGRGCLVRRRHELVADAPHRLDVPRQLGAFAQFVPHVSEVDRHDPRVAEALVAPDLLHELLRRDHPAGMHGQTSQEVELDTRERERPALEHRRSTPQVEHKLADRQAVLGPLPGTRTSSSFPRHLIPRSSIPEAGRGPGFRCPRTLWADDSRVFATVEAASRPRAGRQRGIGPPGHTAMASGFGETDASSPTSSWLTAHRRPRRSRS